MIEQKARRTKVIKSFEGHALTPAEAEQLAREEIDVVRLVYKPEATSQIQAFLAALGERRGENDVAIMLDVSGWTQGVIYGLTHPIEVASGDCLSFAPVGAAGRVHVQTEHWSQLFTLGAKVFLGTGMIALKVKSVSADQAELEVVVGGTIYPEMEVIVPDTRKDPERYNVDLNDLAKVIACGLDYLIVPGQWSPAKMADFRAALVARYNDRAPWLIVKVDSGDVYDSLESLMPTVDGVLISRREMSLTMNAATVPMITKEIIQLCNDDAKVVVTASEMLASMRRNSTPTRAEVSDIANAVIDGTDAVVLSEEVSGGRYGANAVAVMHRIISDIEDRDAFRPNWLKGLPAVNNEVDAVAYSAYRTAHRIKAKALVTITKEGNTALKLASFRPPIPIIAVTFSEAVKRRLAVVRGVETLLLEIDPNLDEVLPMVNDHLLRSSWLKPGDSIIFVAITLSPVGRESSNLLTVQTLS